jgi:hypothetical protein
MGVEYFQRNMVWLHNNILIYSYACTCVCIVCQESISTKHIGEIADNMCHWEGKIAEVLGLTLPEVTGIKLKHKELSLQM